MAIGTDAAIDFFGSQSSLDNTSGAVTDGSFSVTGDLNSWTNSDDAPEASMVFEGTYSTAPDVGSDVLLFAQLLNVESTNDAPVPDANYPHIYMGRFALDNVTTAQYITIDIDLPNYKTSSVYHFFIKNQAGQTLSAGWDLHPAAKTEGPHA